MIFALPLPFIEALQIATGRAIVPTNWSSAQLSQLDQEVKRRAMFSARTTNAEYLQQVKNEIEELLRGETNMATTRARLQDVLDSLDYNPDTHFGDDASIPTAEAGSLRDLSSDKRLQLMLETQVRQAANYGYYVQGQTDFALYTYPALELIRIYLREVPRGTRMSKGTLEHVAGEDWPSRWQKVGGKLHAGRMVARKDDSIWEALGSPDLFDDGLGQPYPPFAFNSGYGVREVHRRDAVALGVIADDYQVEGKPRGFNEGVEAAADFDTEFLIALREELHVSIAEGKLKIATEEIAR